MSKQLRRKLTAPLRHAGILYGPLLANLLADLQLSLQSILVTGRILGRKKTAVYVVLVGLFSALAGYLFGAFVALL